MRDCGSNGADLVPRFFHLSTERKLQKLSSSAISSAYPHRIAQPGIVTVALKPPCCLTSSTPSSARVTVAARVRILLLLLAGIGNFRVVIDINRPRLRLLPCHAAEHTASGFKELFLPCLLASLSVLLRGRTKNSWKFSVGRFRVGFRVKGDNY